MKLGKRLSLFSLLLFALFLAACGASAPAEPAAVSEPEVEVAAEESDDTTAAAALPAGEISRTAYDQIGQTGRLVFLNSYASW